MGKRAKQLSDTVTMTCTARMAGGSVGDGSAERLARIWEMCKIGVFAQARQYASSGIGNDEFKGAVAGTVSNQPALWLSAMLKNIVLQFAQRTHQSGHQSPGQACCYGGILHMLRPLIPEQVVSSAGRWIELAQWEYAGSVTRAGTANQTNAEGQLDLVKDRWFDLHLSVCARHTPARDGELHQRANQARPTKGKRWKMRQTSSSRLPQQIIGNFKSRVYMPWCCLVHRSSRFTLLYSVTSWLSALVSGRGIESLNPRCELLGFLFLEPHSIGLLSTNKGYLIAS